MIEALIGAAVGAVLGAAFAEFFARRRERAAENRHLAELAAARAEAKSNRVLELRLETLDQTKRMMTGLLQRQLASVGGDPRAGDIAIGPNVFPRADATLLNDSNVTQRFMTVATDLAKRAPGSGVTPNDANQVASVQNDITRVLDDQEQRILEGGELRHLDPAVVQPDVEASMAALLGRKAGGPSPE